MHYANRVLMPEQGKEFQEIINENLDNTLNDKQILVVLNFILEVLEYIITRREEEDYHKQPDTEKEESIIPGQRGKAIKKKLLKTYTKEEKKKESEIKKMTMKIAARTT
ncbi:hypothetical protein C2G38_2176505 [Gigaspora rosea]|uniref:Uncharacterized protein n=1 Tax=Gigaspora rosea TaxID=44941 RepID=A0A397VNI5_9GLOM|nr:hypothetical protein C2G38_2176505 [Gigaspora rosea]